MRPKSPLRLQTEPLCLPIRPLVELNDVAGQLTPAHSTHTAARLPLDRREVRTAHSTRQLYSRQLRDCLWTVGISSRADAIARSVDVLNFGIERMLMSPRPRQTIFLLYFSRQAP